MSFIGFKVNLKADRSYDLMYHHFNVDKLPNIDEPQILNCKAPIRDHEFEYSRPLNPINHHANSTRVLKIYS